MNPIAFIRSLPAGAKRFASAVRKEYAARLMDKAVRSVERSEAEYMQMSEAQRLQVDLDTAEILARAAELKLARQGSRYYKQRDKLKSRRAARAKGSQN